MEHNCTVLREKSLKFFEGSKFKRDYEWTSSYFARENSDVLQRKDKDLNGNYGYLAFTNKTEPSTEKICDNFISPLSTHKQNGMPNGIPVLEQQGGNGTGNVSDVNLSQTCKVICDDTSVISVYKDIKQVGHDIKGYVSPREGFLVSSFRHQHFDNISSHETQPSRKATQGFEIPTNNNDNADTSSDIEKRVETESPRVVERVILWEKKSVPCERNAKLTGSVWSQGSQDKILDNTSTVSGQARSLTIKNLVQEDKIVPVSIQRGQSVCYGDLFEENITLEDENKRCDYDGGGGDDDEIVVIAVCDDGNNGTFIAAANDDDDDGIIIHVNNNENDVISNNIRLTKWHDDCHGDHTNMLLESLHENDPHYDSKGFLVRSDEIDTKDDDDDDDVNGGNPFDLDESEYQRLMQAIDDSFDSLLDDSHPNEHDTGSPFDSYVLTGKPTKPSLNEQKSIKIHHEEDGVVGEVITSHDESKCNAAISEELFLDTEESKNSKNKENEFEEQCENQPQNNKFASSSYQIQTEESSTLQDGNSSELFEAEINCVSSLENRTADEIFELDKDGKSSRNSTDPQSANATWLAEHPKDGRLLAKDYESQEQNQLGPCDVDFLFEATNNGTLDNAGVTDEMKEDCRDDIEAVLADTTSNTVDEVVKGDERNGEKEEEEETEQEASCLTGIELSSNMADVLMKEDTMDEVQLQEDEQDQNTEASTTFLKDDEDHENIDGNGFMSLLVRHGIITPLPTQNEELSALHNQDPSSLTQDISLQERIQRINKAIEWVRKELQEMRGVDFHLKVQFDGLRQEARFLREEYEMFVNCEYYDDNEICDEATEYTTCQKEMEDDRNPVLDNKPLLHNALREDSGYHSDTLSTSTDAGSTDNDKPHHTTHAHAKYYYQPQPTHTKIQELTSGKCVFQLVL